MHCYPLEPGTSVFCENPSVHPPKGWQTHLHSERKRCSSEQSNNQPDPPVLYWWWTSQGRFLPLWKPEKAHFPHLYLGATFLLSRCQNRHINTTEYHREEQGSIGTCCSCQMQSSTAYKQQERLQKVSSLLNSCTLSNAIYLVPPSS